MLAVVAVALIVAFGGSVTALIPLYTVGVFIAFTLSQSGMVRRWWRLRARGTGLAEECRDQRDRRADDRRRGIKVAASKFLLGAWVVLILIPVQIARDAVHQPAIHAHLRRKLAVRDDVVIPPPRREERVVVPVPGINRAVIQAINVGRSIASDVRGVLVSDDPAEAAAVRERWDRQLPDVSLVVVESPYRALVGPLLAYLDVLDQAWPPDKEAAITFVVIPEYVASSWWERILYNQSANRLRRALIGRPHTVVVNVPYRRDEPDTSTPPGAAA